MCTQPVKLSNVPINEIDQCIEAQRTKYGWCKSLTFYSVTTIVIFPINLWIPLLHLKHLEDIIHDENLPLENPAWHGWRMNSMTTNERRVKFCCSSTTKVTDLLVRNDNPCEWFALISCRFEEVLKFGSCWKFGHYWEIRCCSISPILSKMGVFGYTESSTSSLGMFKSRRYLQLVLLQLNPRASGGDQRQKHIWVHLCKSYCVKFVSSYTSEHHHDFVQSDKSRVSEQPRLFRSGIYTPVSCNKKDLKIFKGGRNWELRSNLNMPFI